MEENKIAVICFNQKQFDDFVKDSAAYEDWGKFQKVSRIDDIRGRRFCAVVRVGEYWRIGDHRDLYDDALSRLI